MQQVAQDAPGRDVPARTGRGVTLPEPVVVSKFWKDRRHHAIYVELATFENRNVVDVRTYVMCSGKLVATPKGISLSVLRLPELHKAVTKALRQARVLGLLPPDAGAG